MPSCKLVKVSATANGDGADTVTHIYIYDHGSVTHDMIAVFNGCQSAAPNPVPGRRQRIAGTYLFAEEYSLDPNAQNEQLWDITVQFKTPQASGGGKGSTTQNERDLHPILHSPVVTLEDVAGDYVIERAYNISDLTGIGRSALTLGPIVNGAGQRFEDAMLDTAHDPVIVIRRNVGSIAEILELNDTYLRTTNDATIAVFGRNFDARRLKYLVTLGSEQQEFEDIPYWPIETRIGIYKTCDRYVDSVGWKYFDGGGNLVNAIDDNGDQVTEPVFIAGDGTLSANSGTTPVVLGYRHLTEVDYTPLLG